MPPPPVDLTAHLVDLAHQAGYDIALDELDPATGHEPHLVTAWALNAGRQASIAYARSLLSGPEQYLRDTAAAGDDTIAAVLLPAVLSTGHRLDTALRINAHLFARSCRTLAGTRLGLLWPTT